VDGWQQAWLVPAGAGGTISLDFTPQGTYRIALLVGALAVLAMLVGIAIPVSTTGFRPAPATDRWGFVLALAVLTGVLGGAVALGPLAGWLVLRRVSRAPVALWCVAVATALAVAGRLLGSGQAWAQGGIAQALVLVAVTAVVVETVDPPRWPRPGHRSTRRRPAPPA
jgi:arabinofuranan 3-O-arabinosyltransferase